MRYMGEGGRLVLSGTTSGSEKVQIGRVRG